MATEFWREFSSFTGSAHEFEERGYLFIAETPDGLAQMKEPLPLYERLGLHAIGEFHEFVPEVREEEWAG